MQLLLTTPESSLRVKDGLLEVSCPDEKGVFIKTQHAPSLIDSIWINEGTSITTAAIRVAMQNRIDLVICDRFGMPEGRLLSLRPSASSLVQKAQAKISVTPLGLSMARDWVAQKVKAQSALLDKLARRRGKEMEMAIQPYLTSTMEIHERIRFLSIGESVSPDESGTANTIRGLEGAASRMFFEALNIMLPAQYRFPERSRRPAKDPFNAFLNYAFAVLYRKVECALVRAGMNTYIGFMHRDGHQIKSMVYDFIERYRMDMIRAVFGLFSAKNIRPDIHFHSNADQSVTLTKEGKTILLRKINKFYAKTVEWGGTYISRDRMIEKEAVQLAQQLVDWLATVPASGELLTAWQESPN